MPFAVIFDLDGCLADSEPLALEAVAAEMRAFGIAGVEVDDIRGDFLGLTIETIRARINAEAGKPCPPDFQDRVERRLFKAYETGLKPVAGVRAMLERLRDAKVPFGIATGGSRKRMQMTLDAAGLADLFEGRGFSAEEVARGKPAPDVFLYASERLQVAPADTMVVEDSPNGIIGAVAAGMRAVGFTGGSHLDGIREQHAGRLRAAGAAAVFETIAALASALDREYPQ